MENKTTKRYSAAIKATVNTAGWKYLEEILKMERQQFLEKAVTERDNAEAYLNNVIAIDLLFKKIEFYASVKTAKKDDEEFDYEESDSV